MVGLTTFSIFYVFIFNAAVASAKSCTFVFAILLSTTATVVTSLDVEPTPQLIIFYPFISKTVPPLRTFDPVQFNDDVPF